jgi:hypothetical protein
MNKSRNGNGAGANDVAQHLREFAAEVAELKDAAAESPTEALARWLAAHYVVAARRIAHEAGGEGIDLQTLRELSAEVVALRKGDHSAARLVIDRERVEIERGRSEERKRAEFEEWLKQPDIKKRLCGSDLSAAERERRLRDIFGLPERGKGGISEETRAEIEKAMHIL